MKMTRQQMDDALDKVDDELARLKLDAQSIEDGDCIAVGPTDESDADELEDVVTFCDVGRAVDLPVGTVVERLAALPGNATRELVWTTIVAGFEPYGLPEFVDYEDDEADDD